MEYLDFEQPIKELQEQLLSCRLVGEDNGVDVKQACKQIEVAIEESKKEDLFQLDSLAKSTIVKTSLKTLLPRLYLSHDRKYLYRTTR